MNVRFKFLLLIKSEAVPPLAEPLCLLVVLNSDETTPLGLDIDWVIGRNYFESLRSAREILPQHVCGTVGWKVSQQNTDPTLPWELSPIVCKLHL